MDMVILELLINLIDKWCTNDAVQANLMLQTVCQSRLIVDIGTASLVAMGKRPPYLGAVDNTPQGNRR